MRDQSSPWERWGRHLAPSSRSRSSLRLSGTPLASSWSAWAHTYSGGFEPCLTCLGSPKPRVSAELLFDSVGIHAIVSIGRCKASRRGCRYLYRDAAPASESGCFLLDATASTSGYDGVAIRRTAASDVVTRAVSACASRSTAGTRGRGGAPSSPRTRVPRAASTPAGRSPRSHTAARASAGP